MFIGSLIGDTRYVYLGTNSRCLRIYYVSVNFRYAPFCDCV